MLKRILFVGVIFAVIWLVSGNPFDSTIGVVATAAVGAATIVGARRWATK